ncbi:GTP-binding protein [Soehngenia longivitae]|uniref:GTP-binding protein n=1 Tax=Soehngenia longivitae TaxID=2562294 RepID=A0A4Z0D3M7_9FIRM|nr:GTP-binding protein [Soehngenia longivitae]TFZ40187.1 GTP-binding protein [Soehngenia longivitae]
MNGIKTIKTINIGIYGHVDSGKTTLTEAMLEYLGVITSSGTIKAGNTTVDNLEIERKRGITFKENTVSFYRNSNKYNLLDNPGHIDFINNVNITIKAIDLAIVVLACNQNNTLYIYEVIKLLKREKTPIILFINKIDLCDNLQEVEDKISTLQKNNYLDNVISIIYGSALNKLNISKIIDSIESFNVNNFIGGIYGLVYKVNHYSTGNEIYIRLFNQPLRIKQHININSRKIKLNNLFCINGTRLDNCEIVSANDIAVVKDIPNVAVGDIISENGYQFKINYFPNKLYTVGFKVYESHNKNYMKYFKMIELENNNFSIVSADNNVITCRVSGHLLIDYILWILKERFNILCETTKPKIALKETILEEVISEIRMFEEGNPYYASLKYKLVPIKGCNNIITFESKLNTSHFPNSYIIGAQEGIRNNIKVLGKKGNELTDVKFILLAAQIDSVASSPSDFRKLSPLVIKKCLSKTDTKVLEPHIKIYSGLDNPYQVLNSMKKAVYNGNNAEGYLALKDLDKFRDYVWKSIPIIDMQDILYL